MVMAVIFVAILKEGHSPWDIIMQKVMHVIKITTKNVVYRGTVKIVQVSVQQKQRTIFRLNHTSSSSRILCVMLFILTLHDQNLLIKQS